LARWARGALYCLALAYLLAYLGVALRRLGYPFELEWMEGGTLDHLRRVLSGQPLYVPPTLGFVPFLYTPAYYYLAVPLAWIFGCGFLPLRLLSLLASVGLMLLVFALVRRLTGRTGPGILSACLYAASFHVLDGWYDLARVDSLSLFWLFGTLYLLRFGRSWRGQVIAGLCAALAVLTKQTALVILLPVVLYDLFVRRRRALPFLVSATVLLGGSLLALNLVSRGWFAFYTYRLPSGHALVPFQFYYFWSRDLLGPLGIACAVALAHLLLPNSSDDAGDAASASPSAESAPANSGGKGYYASVLAGTLLGSWLARLHSGGTINVALPAFAAVAVGFGLGTAALLRLGEQSAEPRRAMARAAVYGVCLLQFAALLYDPRSHLPSPADRRAGEELVEMLRRQPGDVLVLAHGYLAEMAGKPAHAHYMAIEDVLRARREKATTDLLDELKAAIRDRRFAAVILDHPSSVIAELGGIDLDSSYVRERMLFEAAPGQDQPPRLFLPVSGLPVRPRAVFLPRR
jgi:hypothetical protein